jgi:hypothetical protein
VKRLGLLVLVCVATPAYAGKHPRFEPTDLELEDPGTTELDLQFGPALNSDGWRVLTPDFEADFGVLPNLELDLDGAYAFDGNANVVDNLWPSVKVGLGDWRDDTTKRAWALGLQAGPKLPIAPDNHGVGFEAIALFGYMVGRVHLVFDLGGLIDPHDASAPRPKGFEAGVDLELVLVPDKWSLLGELGGVRYVSDDAHQLATTAGVQYSPNDHVDLSLVALTGFADGSDKFALLAGVSLHLGLF